MVMMLNIVRCTLRPLKDLNNRQTINFKLEATRTYSSWTSRTPRAIVNENELFDPEDTTRERYVKPEQISPQKPKKKEPAKTTEAPVVDETKKSRFTIFGHNDRTIMSLMNKIRSRKRRERNEQILLEGLRMIKEGLEAGGIPEVILFNDPTDIDDLVLPENVKLYKIPYKTIRLWSSVSTSSGIMGIFRTPDVSKTPSDDNALPLTIICDNVRDPGNLGSILRTVASVGCEKLILLKGCVDLWDPKVIRTAAGAHFRTPIHAFPVWDDVPSMISENSNFFVADSNFGDEYMTKYSPDVSQMAMEVFNLDPQNLKATVTADSDQTNESARSESIVPTNKKAIRKFLQKFPVVPYYAVDYTKNETVIVLGGETLGLTPDSYKILNERKGIRINIPVANEVDSLNVGVAVGVVTYEIKRQFLKKQSEIRMKSDSLNVH